MYWYPYTNSTFNDVIVKNDYKIVQNTKWDNKALIRFEELLRDIEREKSHEIGKT